MASILIIDDDASLRRLLRAALEGAGYQVAEAADGASGLAAYRQRAANLVLCDIVMPDREGLETIRELRTRYSGVPIVAMSGGAAGYAMDFLPVAAKLGASATLHKPFSLHALLGTVGDLLGREEARADDPPSRRNHPG